MCLESAGLVTVEVLYAGLSVLAQVKDLQGINHVGVLSKSVHYLPCEDIDDLDLTHFIEEACCDGEMSTR